MRYRNTLISGGAALQTFFASDKKRHELFTNLPWLLGAISIACLLLSWIYSMTFTSAKGANDKLANES